MKVRLIEGTVNQQASCKNTWAGMLSFLHIAHATPQHLRQVCTKHIDMRGFAAVKAQRILVKHIVLANCSMACWCASPRPLCLPELGKSGPNTRIGQSRGACTGHIAHVCQPLARNSLALAATCRQNACEQAAYGEKGHASVDPVASLGSTVCARHKFCELLLALGRWWEQRFGFHALGRNLARPELANFKNVSQ